mgnify:CR=1 FL=1|tara:strand:- start:252 stop:425 length:174 start_codon:yes stop_codon:yes gene_type:complete
MKYIIIYSNDSIDSIVYGTFETEEEANKHAKKMYNNFDSYDWNNEARLHVTKINKVK